MLKNYSSAFDKLMKNEGGYVNNPNDKGGETYKGISRKYFPQWTGWKTIDATKAKFSDKTALNKELPKDNELSKNVQMFYYSEFWLKVCGNNLPDKVDFIIFDFAVNAGIKKAINILQKSIDMPILNIINNDLLNKLKYLNETDIHHLLIKLKANIIDYYKSLNNKNFEKGWLARVDNNFGKLV